MAADYYIEKENLFLYEEDQKVRLAVERLGLNSVAPFDPKKKIIEYIVAEPPDEPLAGMSLRGFIEEVAARSSAPGGGSVSAVLAALGAGLGAMVAKLTYGVRRFEKVDPQMRAVIPPLHSVTRELIAMIDADTSAFNEYMEGVRMPKGTPEEKAARTARMQQGLKTAVRVPLATMTLGDGAWEALCETARFGNPASRSDVQVGARSLETGIWGAYQNVLINLEGITDEAFKAETRTIADAMADRARRKMKDVLEILEDQRECDPPVLIY